MDWTFDGVHLASWLAWAAPALGLACAAVMGLWLVCQHAIAALRSQPVLAADPFTKVLPLPTPPAPPAATMETRADLPAMRTLATALRPPSFNPAMIPARVRDRMRSSIFRRRERRVALRRGGDPLPVDVSDAQGAAPPMPGKILDRSRTGVCLLLDESLPVNTVVSIRSHMYAEDANWVQIRVRHCRPRGDQFVLGCQFTVEQPWSVLLLFG
jgi:PilZ domain